MGKQNDVSDNINPGSDEGLLHWREVAKLLGLKCNTSHTVRTYARNELICVIKINARNHKYTQSSVMDVVRGKKKA